MEVLLYIGLELLGLVILASTVYLGFGARKEKQKKLSKAEQIAAETARLEAENKRLELEYEKDRDTKFSVLEPAARPLPIPADLPERVKAKADQFAAEVRAARIKAEFAYYQQFGRLPSDSLLDNHEAARLTSFYESSRAKTFNTVPLILTDGTRIEFKFRKLS